MHAYNPIAIRSASHLNIKIQFRDRALGLIDKKVVPWCVHVLPRIVEDLEIMKILGQTFQKLNSSVHE